MCKLLKCTESWAEMGRTCLHHIEVELAVQVYRMTGNVGMVMSLEDIKVSMCLCLSVCLFILDLSVHNNTSVVGHSHR